MEPSDLNGASGSGSHDYMPSSSSGSSEVGRPESPEAGQASQAKPYSNKLTTAKIAQQTLEQSKNQPEAASSIKKSSASNSLGTAITAVARKIGNVINKITSPLASSTKLTSSHFTNLPDNSNPANLAQKPWLLADKRAELIQKESDIANSKSLGKTTGTLRDEVQQLKNLIRDTENAMLRMPTKVARDDNKQVIQMTKELGALKAGIKRDDNLIWGTPTSQGKSLIQKLNFLERKANEYLNDDSPLDSTLKKYVDDLRKADILELEIRLGSDPALNRDGPERSAQEDRLNVLKSPDTDFRELVTLYKNQGWSIEQGTLSKAGKAIQSEFTRAAREFVFLGVPESHKGDPTLEDLITGLGEKEEYTRVNYDGADTLSKVEMTALSDYLNAAKEMIRYDFETRINENPDDANLKEKFDEFMNAYHATSYDDSDASKFRPVLEYLVNNEWAIEIGLPKIEIGQPIEDDTLIDDDTSFEEISLEDDQPVDENVESRDSSEDITELLDFPEGVLDAPTRAPSRELFALPPIFNEPDDMTTAPLTEEINKAKEGDSPAVDSLVVRSELDPQVQGRYELLKHGLVLLCNDLNEILKNDPNLNPERDETTKLLDALIYQSELNKAEAAVNTKIGEIKDIFQNVITDEEVANQIVGDLTQIGVFLGIDEIKSGKIQISTFHFSPDLFRDYMQNLDEGSAVTATNVIAQSAPAAAVGAAAPSSEEIVASIFKGKGNKVLVLEGDNASVPYLGAAATETEVSNVRKAAIAGIEVRGKFGILPAAKDAIAFSEKHPDGAEVSPYGGDNAAQLQKQLAKTLEKAGTLPEETQFQLFSGDTVVNLKKLQDEIPEGRKAAAVNCANDTLYGSIWKTGGSQEEQVFRKSNLSALADQFNAKREGKEHHIPILGAMYVKDATFMDPADMSKPVGERGSFKGDITFVAALDLSKGYVRKEVQAAADAAGIDFNDFVKYITKMKYAAALGSMLENGVTDVLMSLPGTGSFQNPLNMVQEVLQELLFVEGAPFKNRFATVNFNVFGNAATASPGDRAVATMLRDELGVPVDNYITSFNSAVVQQQVKDISAKHGEMVARIAENPLKVVGFYYSPLSNVEGAEKSNPTGFLGNFAPCNCEVFGFKFRCVEAAFQWKKYDLASRPQDGDKPKLAQRRVELANDPRMHKLISATGDEAFHLNRELERDYDGVFAPKWREGERDHVMWEALNAKFEQNPEYADMLISTGDAYLLEHNEKLGRDVYWSDNANGTGHNMLGKMLMAIREGKEEPNHESAFVLDAVSDDPILSAKLIAFNTQQNSKSKGISYTIFAR